MEACFPQSYCWFVGLYIVQYIPRFTTRSNRVLGTSHSEQKKSFYYVERSHLKGTLSWEIRPLFSSKYSSWVPYEQTKRVSLNIFFAKTCVHVNNDYADTMSAYSTATVCWHCDRVFNDYADTTMTMPTSTAYFRDFKGKIKQKRCQSLNDLCF